MCCCRSWASGTKEKATRSLQPTVVGWAQRKLSNNGEDLPDTTGSSSPRDPPGQTSRRWAVPGGRLWRTAGFLRRFLSHLKDDLESSHGCKLNQIKLAKFSNIFCNIHEKTRNNILICFGVSPLSTIWWQIIVFVGEQSESNRRMLLNILIISSSLLSRIYIKVIMIYSQYKH